MKEKSNEEDESISEQELLKLSKSKFKKYKEREFHMAYLNNPKIPKKLIAEKLDISLQRFEILSSRLKRNYSLEKLKRGRKSLIKENHMEFLKEWFSKD